MSSKPQTVSQGGLSKSAAKKRAKKAAKPPTQSNEPTNVHHHYHHNPNTHTHPQSIPSYVGDVRLDQLGAAAQGLVGGGGRYHNHTHSQHPPPGAPPLPPTTGGVPPLDPALFNFTAPGSYPVDSQYETAYYDQVDIPLNQSSFPGSYSIDYNLSLQNGGALAGLSAPFNITHEDLISAANELYKRMADPEFGADDAYWSSLPPHIRQFIRDAVPFTGSISQNTPGNNSSQRTMYQMAQQIVQAASQGMGLGQGGANLMAGINGVNGRQYSQSGIAEELGFHRHPDAKEEDYEDEDDLDADEADYAAPNGDAPKKKNKKKKKKNVAVEPIPAPLPPPVAKQPPRQAPAMQVPSQLPPPQPALNPPPPPVTPASVHPPPSSRAAGKQPMSNTTAPASNPPARSARAAGKAPATAAPAHSAHSGHNHNHPPAPAAAPKAAAKGKAPAAAPPAKIWTQSSAEDRENIRLFWLGLSEAERKDLLRIEKDAVLRRMKEQHRHSCGCAVCGRKKVNIEMELDQLYEQYYDELRSYAAEQRAATNGMRPPPTGAGPFPGSVEVDSTGAVTQYDHRAPDPHDHDHTDLDGEESEEYEDEDDDEYVDEDEEDIGSEEGDVGDDIDDGHQHPPPVAQRQTRQPPAKTVAPRPEGADDFLSFGANLATIKGGILTIADDMLKNDGSKFLEMMEQLAIRRSIREEQNIRDLQEETDDEDDESKDDEPLTDQERAEEGKRMFQIFAARMFEQRVLQAYREKVAKQREEQLLRELEEEEDSKRAKEEKKAKESQKKKDKKRLQKLKADEEKAAREAAIAEEQQAARVKAEEAEKERLRKQEEERLRREAQKRAQAEEAQKQANERRKRQQEEKEREEEAARKKREREEKARKEREAREKEAKERERREREEKAAREKVEKERIAKEKAEKAERDRLAKEAKDKADKERQAKLEEERVEKARKDEAARKEREAAEQAKILAAQQAQRAKAEKAAAEKAAAAERAAAEKLRASAAIPSAPVPVPGSHARLSPRSGPTPQTTPPITQPSPVKGSRVPSGPSASGSGSASRPQKTPQPYYPQPIPPVGVAYQRMPIPQTYAPGFRQAPGSGFPQSPAFSPPQANGPSISPNPPPRGFAPEPSPPFDHGMRTAPIGMGFPPVKSSGRIPSADDAFSPPTAPIGAARQLSGSAGPGDIGSLLSSQTSDDFRSSPAPAPIAPPGPIGRPSISSFLDPPVIASGSSGIRSSSPAPPDQVFGSAALGGDDEIVQPQRRVMSNGWGEVPAVGSGAVGAAPGTGRWSSSPSIWGSETLNPSSSLPSSAWGGSAMPTIGENRPGVGVGVGAPGGPSSLASSLPGPGIGGAVGSRQTSFGGIGSGFGGVGLPGMGGGGFPQNIFNQGQGQQHPHAAQQQQQHLNNHNHHNHNQQPHHH